MLPIASSWMGGGAGTGFRQHAGGRGRAGWWDMCSSGVQLAAGRRRSSEGRGHSPRSDAGLRMDQGRREETSSAQTWLSAACGRHASFINAGMPPALTAVRAPSSAASSKNRVEPGMAARRCAVRPGAVGNHDLSPAGCNGGWRGLRRSLAGLEQVQWRG